MNDAAILNSAPARVGKIQKTAFMAGNKRKKGIIMASLEQLTIDIHMKATEDAEKFVFETVSPYVNDQLKMTITKQELLDAFRAKEKLDNLKELLQNMAHFNGQVKAEFLLGMLEKEDEQKRSSGRRYNTVP